MKKLITVLLSAALIWSIQQNTPVNKSFADKANAKPVQVATTKKVAEVKSSPQTEQEPVIEPAPEPPKEEPVQPPLTDHEQMMYQAGISPEDYGAVEYIVFHESSWNPSAVNQSSGSCGLVQELPCGKSGCGLGDGVCQLRWASQYATQRYGSWWGAYSYWVSNQWW